MVASLIAGELHPATNLSLDRKHLNNAYSSQQNNIAAPNSHHITKHKHYVKWFALHVM